MAAERYTRALDMIRDADTAMYRAKDLGKARCEFFDTSMLALVEERLQLESDLRRAVDRQELVLHYQPIVALAGAELCGFEALVRWRHPTRGLISPEAFIPIAEETGLILPIGLWVLREACRQMRVWEAEFPECSSLMLNVNLSVKQCLAPRLVEQVAGILRDTGYPAERLKLEITESLVLENPDRASEILHALRRLGVQLGLDDFGTGYSGLTHLQRLPVQTLKIDRSFVDGIQRSENVEIIRAIVSLAAGLAMNVTAEGVETADQAARIRELACEFGQGFYFHKPLSQERAEAVLREREWPIATTPQPLGAHST
jgi:EAL domain-containing protein (putative c-di-GMP-specific phosphodiesterase class I)